MTTKNLAKRGQLFIFRMKVPQSIGSGEFCFSLETRCRRKACRLATKITRRIKAVNMEELTKEKLRELVQEFVREGLADFRESELRQGRTSDEAWEHRLMALEAHLSNLKEALTLRDFRRDEEVADRILTEKGLTASPELRADLVYQLALMNVEMTERGIDAIRSGVLPNENGGLPSFPVSLPDPPLRPSVESRVDIKDLIEKWWTENSPRWSPRSLKDRERMRKVIEDNFTKTEATRDGVRHFKEYLLGRELATKTVNGHIELLSGIFNWGILNGLVETNPAKGMQVRETKKERTRDKRVPFDAEDLRNLFGSEFAQYRGTSKGWVMLVGLYTGMRLEEICQLYVDDIQQSDSGIWCFVVEAKRPDQSVKTGEKRKVPIHSELIRLGFLDFIAGRPGDERVFSDLVRVNHRYGHGTGQWFGRYKRRLGLDDPRKVFHSFRKNVASCLKESEVQDSIVADLLGHVMQGQTFGRYAGGASVERLKEAVEKLKYPIEVG